MALLNIDRNSLTLQVKVGVLETYKPDEDIEHIHKEVEKLRDKFQKNMKRIIGKGNPAELQQVLNTDEKKLNRWTTYIENTFSKQLKEIQLRIVDKNKKICGNFEEAVLSKEK